MGPLGKITLTLIFCLTLTACSLRQPDPEALRQRTAQQLQKGCTATMEIESGSVQAQATLERKAPGAVTISFTEPQRIAGLGFTVEGETVTAFYKNLSARFTMEELFDSAAAKQVVCALDRTFGAEGVSLSLTDEALTAEGPAASGRYIFRMDRDSGSFLSLSIPEQQLEIRFRDFLFGA